MGNDNCYGKEEFNPEIMFTGEGKKDLPSVNIANPHEMMRVEFEEDSGVYRKDWSDCLSGINTPSKLWERSFAAWLIDVKMKAMKAENARLREAVDESHHLLSEIIEMRQFFHDGHNKSIISKVIKKLNKTLQGEN